MTIVYHRTDDTLNTSIRAEVRDFDYKESPDDRRTYQLGADLNYRVSPLVDGGLNVSYRHLEEDDTNRTDKEYRIVGNINYHLSRDLRSAFAVRFQNKSSDVKLDEYNETAVFIGLIWGGGSVPHTGIL